MASTSKSAYIPPGKRSKSVTSPEDLAESFIPPQYERMIIEEKGNKKIEHAVISFDTLVGLTGGLGGSGGIIPWYIDERTNEIKFILNITRKYNGLLGYIGGGIKPYVKKKTKKDAKEEIDPIASKPINQILEEIEDETPQWKDYLYSLLFNPAYQRLVIARDEYYPMSALKTSRSIRMSLLIFLRVDPRIMNEATFIPSLEIERLYVTSLHGLIDYQPPPTFVSNWNGYEHGLSNGLIHVMEVLTTSNLFVPFWKYIRLNITFDEYKGLLRMMYQTNNIENKVVWTSPLSIENDLSLNEDPEQSSPPRSPSRSPPKQRSQSRSPKWTAVTKSTKKSTKKSSKKSTKKSSKKSHK